MAHAGNRYEGKMIRKRKLEKLLDETSSRYGAGAYVTDSGRIKKYSCNKKFVRTMCNRKFRRLDKQTASGGAYKKVFNYWNEVI